MPFRAPGGRMKADREEGSITENEEKKMTDAEEEGKLEELALLRTMNYISALDSVMGMEQMFTAGFAGLEGAEEYMDALGEDDEEYQAFSQIFKAPEMDFSMFDMEGMDEDPDYFCEDGEIASDVAKALGLF